METFLSALFELGKTVYREVTEWREADEAKRKENAARSDAAYERMRRTVFQSFGLVLEENNKNADAALKAKFDTSDIPTVAGPAPTGILLDDGSDGAGEE